MTRPSDDYPGFRPDPDMGGPPDHYWAPGCCGQDKPSHLMTPAETRELGEWMDTEPGMRQRLGLRRDQLARLRDLDAPEIIIRNQQRLIAELEHELGDNQQ
jgi:hypothetical protein